MKININRLALVIGNSNYYNITKLNNPCNDANDMAEKLEQLNFKVYKCLDVEQDELIKVITKFKKELNEYSTGLFYYAGHGMQIKGSNYLVPVDCKISSEEITALSCYQVDDLLNSISMYKDKTNIIILDSCRTNPFARLLRGSMISGFTSLSNPPQGTIISFATSPDSTADDGSHGNGLFTGVLKSYIDRPNIKIEDLFKLVRTKVIELSGGQQLPWEHSSLMGDFYFSIKSINENNSISDKEIYDFINKKYSDYSDRGDIGICDAECLPYIDAYKKFKMPIIELLRSYSRIQYRNQNMFFSDNYIDEINMGYLEAWGFEYKNYRWYYNDKYVKVGEPLPLSEKLHELSPIEGKEINVKFDLTSKISNDLVYFTVKTNLPNNTPIMWTIKDKNSYYLAQCHSIVINGETSSEGFSNLENTIDDGMYNVSLTSTINAVQPEGVKEIFGERNRNLVGENVMFDPIGGNVINFKKIIVKINGEIVVF